MDLQECEKYYFDNEAANRVVFFIENHIKHSKGEYGGKEVNFDFSYLIIHANG